jgi:hypothetical protein
MQNVAQVNRLDEAVQPLEKYASTSIPPGGAFRLIKEPPKLPLNTGS